MDREIVGVELGKRRYDVIVGSNLQERLHHELAPFLERQRVYVISERRVWDIHGARLKEALRMGGDIDCPHLLLPPGEATKNWATLRQVCEWLLEMRAERDDLILAFGGGVIGDLVGAAAAITRRGIRFVQIPTTLLAQVDSSVGGKTGINSPFGKNLIGAFYQPVLVLADIDYLATMAPRDFLSGMGEVVKYGLLGDAVFFEWLENNGEALISGDPDLRRYAVKRAIEMKAEIVVQDETEKGARALLNLGHTFCHALEAATGYSDRLLHGEGVAIGCGLAFEVSQKLGYLAQEVPSRVRGLFEKLGMKSDLSHIDGDLPDAASLIALMRQDKKVSDGQIAFILARGIGQAFVDRGTDLALVEKVLEEGLKRRF